MDELTLLVNGIMNLSKEETIDENLVDGKILRDQSVASIQENFGELFGQDLSIKRILARIKYTFINKKDEFAIIIDNVLKSLYVAWHGFWLNFSAIKTFMAEETIIKKIELLFMKMVSRESARFLRSLQIYDERDTFIHNTNIERFKSESLNNLIINLMPYKIYIFIMNKARTTEFTDTIKTNKIKTEDKMFENIVEGFENVQKPPKKSGQAPSVEKDVESVADPSFNITKNVKILPKESKTKYLTCDIEGLCPLLGYQTSGELANVNNIKNTHDLDEIENKTAINVNSVGCRMTKVTIKDKKFFQKPDYSYIFDSKPLEPHLSSNEVSFLDQPLLNKFKDDLIDILSNEQVYSQQQAIVYRSISHCLTGNYVSLDMDIFYGGPASVNEVDMQELDVQIKKITNNESSDFESRTDSRHDTSIKSSLFTHDTENKQQIILEENEKNDLFEMSETSMELREIVQTRLDIIFTALKIQNEKVQEILHKFANSQNEQLTLFLYDMELAIRAIYKRETLLSGMTLFEWEASDPGRLFLHGRYSATHHIN